MFRLFPWILFSRTFLCMGLVRVFWGVGLGGISMHVTGFGLSKRWWQNFDGLAVCTDLPTFGKCYYVRSAVKVACVWNVMAHGDAREGKWRWKLANALGSQYPSHYLGTRCIQHYYRWCRTPRLVSSRLNWRPPPGRFKWTGPFGAKDEIWFLRMCRHNSNADYPRPNPAFGIWCAVKGGNFIVLYLNELISHFSSPIWLFKTWALKKMLGPRREAVGRGEQYFVMFIFKILPFRQILAGP